MREPIEILRDVYEKAASENTPPLKASSDFINRIGKVCLCDSNRACVRLLMACLLAKIHNPSIDPTQPYTEIASEGCFSGRTYDEQYISALISEYNLPCNSTTAFLTPALRNIDHPLSVNIEIVGRPREIYRDAIAILEEVKNQRAGAEEVLIEVLRLLIQLREERSKTREILMREIRKRPADLSLSAEDTVSLIESHLACKHSSRLPVLVVAAAYGAVRERIGEVTTPLRSHNAADEQTGGLGDVEICLVGDGNVRTVYEMKKKKVTVQDIDRAVQKISAGGESVTNYIFITTEEIDPKALEYARQWYEKTGQREIAILDCIGFLRHFLHFFHSLRRVFLDEYQRLLLLEPESSIRPELKSIFFDLRRNYEASSDGEITNTPLE